MVLVGLGLLISGNGLIGSVSSVEQNAFLCIVAIVFGILQLSSIALCRTMEHLRFILAWISGSFWIWVATADISHTVTAAEIATIMLGVTNLYAFIINLLLVKQSWK